MVLSSRLLKFSLVNSHLFVRKVVQAQYSFARTITEGKSVSSSPNSEAGNVRAVSSHKVEVNGAEIHYDKCGYGKKNVLLLPGALGSGETDFAHQVSHMNRDLFTVIAWDPRGYGKSIPPERTWENFFERDANDAAMLMKNIGIEKYSLVGWSDGGITALIMAGRNPQNVTKLVVWGANSFVTDEDIKLYENIRDLDKWSPRMREPFENLYGRDYFKKHWNLWIDSISSYRTKSDGDICRKEVEKVACPTLIIHGQQDAMVPQSHAEYLNQHIKISSLHLMPKGKHNLHMKYHKEFNSLVEAFLLK